MAEEDDVIAELDAVEAVYGDDCVVLRSFPPCVRIHIRPRTADDSSKQFVEAVMEIRAGTEYPNRSPEIEIMEAKGFDHKRQAELLASVQMKARDLCSYLMLVALCEEAVEMLTSMNHPDGDCPLCLYPLLPNDGQIEELSYMKLMSCFHCFHSWCILKWWRWVQEQSEKALINDIQTLTFVDAENIQEMDDVNKTATCPVCRKVFHAKDIEHVLDLHTKGFLQETASEAELEDANKFLHSEAEVKRRKEFEVVLKVQEENKGLVELGKSNVLFQRLSELDDPSMPTEDASIEQREMSFNTNQFTVNTVSVNPMNKPGSSNYRRSNMERKQTGSSRRKQCSDQSSKQRWVEKKK